MSGGRREAISSTDARKPLVGSRLTRVRHSASPRATGPPISTVRFRRGRREVAPVRSSARRSVLVLGRERACKRIQKLAGHSRPKKIRQQLRAAADRGVGVAVRGEHDHLAGQLPADRLLEESREGAMRWVEVRGATREIGDRHGLAEEGPPRRGLTRSRMWQRWRCMRPIVDDVGALEACHIHWSAWASRT